MRTTLLSLKLLLSNQKEVIILSVDLRGCDLMMQGVSELFLNNGWAVGSVSWSHVVFQDVECILLRGRSEPKGHSSPSWLIATSVEDNE